MKISIITATWNSAEMIDDCLASVAEQSHPDIEHVVIDGGSLDGTMAKLEAKQEQLAFLLSEPDQGIYDALNKGLFKTTGEVVGFLHSDDLYAHAEVLADIAKAFQDPQVCAVYGDLNYVKRRDSTQIVRKWKSAEFTQQRLSHGWMPPHPTLYVRRKCYQLIGGFDVKYKISADFFCILQLFRQTNFKSIYLPQVLVIMRLGGASNKSFKAVINKSKEDWRALRCSGFGVFQSAYALLWKNLSKIKQFL